MTQLAAALMFVLGLGCLLLALTTDSEGGVAWTATLIALGAGCLIGGLGLIRRRQR